MNFSDSAALSIRNSRDWIDGNQWDEKNTDNRVGPSYFGAIFGGILFAVTAVVFSVICCYSCQQRRKIPSTHPPISLPRVSYLPHPQAFELGESPEVKASGVDDL